MNTPQNIYALQRPPTKDPTTFSKPVPVPRRTPDPSRTTAGTPGPGSRTPAPSPAESGSEKALRLRIQARTGEEATGSVWQCFDSGNRPSGWPDAFRLKSGIFFTCTRYKAHAWW